MTGEAMRVATSALAGGLVLGVALWALSLLVGGSERSGKEDT